MLTVRTLREADDEARVAVEPLTSPGAFVRPEDPPNERAYTIWAGAAEALGCLGVKSGTQAKAGPLAAAIAGRHTATGARVRAHGAAFDLTLLVPRSLSWVWAQAETDLRSELEQTVVNAAYYALQHQISFMQQLAETGPQADDDAPAPGFAAALALHAVGQPRPQTPPPPLLHVHGYLLGILDESGKLYGPSLEALFEADAVLASGAFGRAKLAEDLRELGFGTEVVPAPEGRRGRLSFEISGVPEGLLRVEGSADKGCAGLGRETARELWEIEPPESDPWENDPWDDI